MCCIVFLVKQKTAYEMRISDWSSDVCSSDLLVIAMNIAAFTTVGEFAHAASALAGALKALPKAPGTDEILMPGERGAATEVKRRRDGRSEESRVGTACVRPCRSRWSPTT